MKRLSMVLLGLMFWSMNTLATVLDGVGNREWVHWRSSEQCHDQWYYQVIHEDDYVGYDKCMQIEKRLDELWCDRAARDKLKHYSVLVRRTNQRVFGDCDTGFKPHYDSRMFCDAGYWCSGPIHNKYLPYEQRCREGWSGERYGDYCEESYH